MMVRGTTLSFRFQAQRGKIKKTQKLRALMAWIRFGPIRARGQTVRMALVKTDSDPTPQASLNYGKSLSGRTLARSAFTLTTQAKQAPTPQHMA